MVRIIDKITKIVVIAAGFAMPYVEEYIGMKQQISGLKNNFSVLEEENLTLKKENEKLKQQILIAAIIGAASIAAFFALLIVSVIR